MSDEWLEELELVVLDRSTLEMGANCPAQLKLVESGKCVRESLPLNVGVECHDVLSRTLRTYLSAPHEFNPFEVREELFAQMVSARPDIQPQVIENLRSIMYEWSRFISQDMHHDNILRYDGGEGEHSGQLSIDLTHLGARVTSEVDFLYTGPSPDVLHEVDYKSGHTPHTAQSVKDSFQFQMHAALILNTYPDLQAVEVRVWRTLTNHKTYRVVFDRKNLPQYMARVHKAAELCLQSRSKSLEKVPTYPEQSKCGMCEVSHLCPRLECRPTDPVEMLEKLIVVEKAEEELRKLLISAAKKSGGEIRTPAGDVFTAVKPNSTAKWKTVTATEPETEEVPA